MHLLSYSDSPRGIVSQVRGFQTLVRVCPAPALSGMWEARAEANPAEAGWLPAALLGQESEFQPGVRQLPLRLLSLYNSYPPRLETLQLRIALDQFLVRFFVVEDSVYGNSQKTQKLVLSRLRLPNLLLSGVWKCSWFCDWYMPLAFCSQIRFKG